MQHRIAVCNLIGTQKVPLFLGYNGSIRWCEIKICRSDQYSDPALYDKFSPLTTQLIKWLIQLAPSHLTYDARKPRKKRRLGFRRALKADGMLSLVSPLLSSTNFLWYLK